MINRIVRFFASLLVWFPIFFVAVFLMLVPLAVPWFLGFGPIEKIWSFVNLILSVFIIYLTVTKVLNVGRIISQIVKGEAIAAVVVGFTSFVVMPGVAKGTGLVATGFFLLSLLVGLLILAINEDYYDLLIVRLLSILCVLYFVYGMFTILWTIFLLL